MAAAEEALLKRVLPHSIEAEQSVIGSMIMDREAITVASEIISGDDFYNRQYGVVFDTMVELNDEGRPVDLVTLQDRLKEKDVPPEVSSLEFIRDLITAVPTSANIKYYAGIVAEKSTLRKLIRLNEEIANTCYVGKENLEVILEDTEKRVFELVQKRNTGEFVPIRQVVMNAMDKIEKASKSNGNVTGIATGFIDLDYRTAGMQPSDLILVAARPSMGKTAFVLNIAQYVAFKLNQTVAIFSLEMSKEQLVNRLFSLESKVDSQHLRTGNLSDAEWEKLIESAGVIGKSNLIIDDTPGISISELRSKCRKYKLEHDLKIIIIDYLQLMSGSGRGSDSRQQEISKQQALSKQQMTAVKSQPVVPQTPTMSSAGEATAAVAYEAAAAVSSPDNYRQEFSSSYNAQLGALEMRVAKGDLTFLPPMVMTIVTQRPSVHIEYLGDFNYVPPRHEIGRGVNLFT